MVTYTPFFTRAFIEANKLWGFCWVTDTRESGSRDWVSLDLRVLTLGKKMQRMASGRVIADSIKNTHFQVRYFVKSPAPRYPRE